MVILILGAMNNVIVCTFRREKGDDRYMSCMERCWLRSLLSGMDIQ